MHMVGRCYLLFHTQTHTRARTHVRLHHGHFQQQRNFIAVAHVDSTTYACNDKCTHRRETATTSRRKRRV